MFKLLSGTTVIEDPPIARFLFSDVRMSWFWLLVRVYIGYQWFDTGLRKLSDPKWIGDGSALLGYWQNAVRVPATGRPPITYDWYRDFLNVLLNAGAHEWFARVIVWGEVLVGLGLILGALVGVAAFFGALMNLNFMLAGTASTNPVLFLVAALLMLAWKTAGYWGLDRILLPLLGTPWHTGRLFRREPGLTAAR